MKIVLYEKVASSACNSVNYTHAFHPDNHQTQYEAEAAFYFIYFLSQDCKMMKNTMIASTFWCFCCDSY